MRGECKVTGAETRYEILTELPAPAAGWEPCLEPETSHTVCTSSITINIILSLLLYYYIVTIILYYVIAKVYHSVESLLL